MILIIQRCVKYAFFLLWLQFNYLHILSFLLNIHLEFKYKYNIIINVQVYTCVENEIIKITYFN